MSQDIPLRPLHNVEHEVDDDASSLTSSRSSFDHNQSQKHGLLPDQAPDTIPRSRRSTSIIWRLFGTIVLLVFILLPALVAGFFRLFRTHSPIESHPSDDNVLPIVSSVPIVTSTDFSTIITSSIVPTVSTAITSTSHPTITPPSTTPLRLHPAQDYILDPNWDFKAPAQRREYHWSIEDEELNPDGVYRPMVTINKSFPGPLIECNEGDTLVVEVHNNAINATSIHWHGIYQNGTNWMDGTVGITQCPIAPGHNFTYEFTVNGQSGTYFYHSHHGVQASDGLVGPLVIHSQRDSNMEYATDRVVMVQDHYHDLSGALLMKYLAPDRENVEPVPDGALINGKAVRDCSQFPNRKCDNSTISRTVFDLAPQQKHRLRFINTGAFAEFQIQVDENEFAVIEVDGTDVIPAHYHRLNISPGQRYSIVLSAESPVTDTFWLRARMITQCFGEENFAMEPEVRAIVRYQSDPLVTLEPEDPTSLDWPEVVEVICKDMNTTELIPLDDLQMPQIPDELLYVRASFRIGDWRLSRGLFNTSYWRPDVSSPSLNRAIDGLSNQDESFTSPIAEYPAIVNDIAFDLEREFVIQTKGIQTIDIAVQNFEDSSHPLHLHGYKFFVLATGHGGFDEEAVYESLNQTNPLRRDVATVEGYGWILLRIVADNPGMWAFHCHVSWHSEAGLLMQFLTRSDVVANWTLPSKNRELCEMEGIEKGTRPSDDLWFGDFGR